MFSLRFFHYQFVIDIFYRILQYANITVVIFYKGSGYLMTLTDSFKLKRKM